MQNVRLNPAIKKRLEQLSKRTDRSVSDHANLAIRQYLDDLEDYGLGLAALLRKEPRIPLEELERELGLAR